MSSDQNGWRGLAADLLAAEPMATQSIERRQSPPPGASEVAAHGSSSIASGKRRRRRNGESFASTNQLVGLWLPHDMAAELRSRAEPSRAEQAGLSNSEFVRQILRERFDTSRERQR